MNVQVEAKAVDERGSEVLSPSECLRLLAESGGAPGRLGILVQGRVVVLPYNFLTDGDGLVLRVGPGATLEALLSEPLVAFEVDHFEPSAIDPFAWSVLVQGEARVVRDPVGLDELRALGVAPFIPEPGELFVRISIETVSGRRFRINALAATRYERRSS